VTRGLICTRSILFLVEKTYLHQGASPLQNCESASSPSLGRNDRDKRTPRQKIPRRAFLPWEGKTEAGAARPYKTAVTCAMSAGLGRSETTDRAKCTPGKSPSPAPLFVVAGDGENDAEFARERGAARGACAGEW
jgi:hypothetical protein